MTGISHTTAVARSCDGGTIATDGLERAGARLQYLDTRDPAVDEHMSLEAMGL